MLGIQKMFTSTSRKDHDNCKTKPQESGSEFRRVGKVDDGVGSYSHRCFKSDESKNMLTIDEEEHHTKLGEHAAKLWKHKNLTDVVIKLRGQSYEAHKTVLSCYSRYFEVLLLTDSNSSIINLESKSITNEAFSVLLQFMYTSSLVITCQNIGEVFTAAKKLQMDKAVNICTKILNGTRKQEVHSVYTYVTAKQLGLKDAWVKALRTMCKRFEQIVGTQEYQDLKHDQVMEYLRQDTLATRSEVLVYLAALKWISVRYLEREQFAIDVVGCVRFPLMTLHEILACHTPPLLPGLTEIPEIKGMLLKATCFIAATTVNEEKRFQRYNCTPRTYLLEKETFILWDPNIFDPDLYALYEKEQAATAIQAVYRGYKTRKSISIEHDAAETIQSGYRDFRTKKGAAATTIQANYRGYKTRKSISKEHGAATTIQANYRGYRTRKSISKESCKSFDNESDSDDGSHSEEEKVNRMSFGDTLMKSMTSLFRRASSKVEEKQRRDQEEGKERKDLESREFGRSMESQPPSKWTPEVSSNTDALHGTVENVPRGWQKERNGRINGKVSESLENELQMPLTDDYSSHTDVSAGNVKHAPKGNQKERIERNGLKNGKVSERLERQLQFQCISDYSSHTDVSAGAAKRVSKEDKKASNGDPRSQDKKKQLEDRYAHPPYSTAKLAIQQPDPPPWLPEVSSSLDALAGTVVNMTKNLDVPEAKSKDKLFLPGEHHFANQKKQASLDSILSQEQKFENYNKRVSLDSILSQEAESKTAMQCESGGVKPLFRAIIITGGFEVKDEDDSETDSKLDGYRSSPTCCGRQDVGKLMFHYDPAANQWSAIGQMPKARHHHCLVYLDNIIYCIGGCDPSTTKSGKMVALNTCFSFDLTSQKWKKMAKMRHCRIYHAAAALDGKIYVVGGKDDSEVMLDSIEVYDPKLNKWQELAETLVSPTMHLGLCGHKGRLWTIGGMMQNEGNNCFVKDVRCYCPGTDSWNHDVPNLPTPRAFIAAIECGNHVYVVGGATSADTEELDCLSDMLFYDENRKMWRNTAPMPSPCHSLGVATCGKSIFILGGRYKQDVLDQVTVFSKNPESWYRCSSLPVPLCGFAAVSIPKVIESK